LLEKPELQTTIPVEGAVWKCCLGHW